MTSQTPQEYQHTTLTNSSQSVHSASIQTPSSEASTDDKIMEEDPPLSVMNGTSTSQATSSENASKMLTTSTLEAKCNEVELPVLNGGTNGVASSKITRLEVPDSEASELSSPVNVASNETTSGIEAVVSPAGGSAAEDVQNEDADDEDVELKDSTVVENAMVQTDQSAVARAEMAEDAGGDARDPTAEEVRIVKDPIVIDEDFQMGDENSMTAKVDEPIETADLEFSAPKLEDDGDNPSAAASPPIEMDERVDSSRIPTGEENIWSNGAHTPEKSTSEVKEGPPSLQLREEVGTVSTDPQSQAKTIPTGTPFMPNIESNPLHVYPPSSEPNKQHRESNMETGVDGASIKTAVEDTGKDKRSPGNISTPNNGRDAESVTNFATVTPNNSFTAAKSPQNKDVLMAELKAMKIASLQARNAALQSEIANKRSKLEAVTRELANPAAETVKRHIKLLHDYNDIRDVGQGLVGMIADNRGVRIGELYEEFGVGLKD